MYIYIATRIVETMVIMDSQLVNAYQRVPLFAWPPKMPAFIIALLHIHMYDNEFMLYYTYDQMSSTNLRRSFKSAMKSSACSTVISWL